MDQSPQSPPTEFDIVRVAPQLAQVDLVLFSNVSSCYRSDKNITANYILGQDVKPTSWDWIGIFHSEWRLLGDYVAYRWSKAYGPDCTAPKRRAIVFPREIHQLQSHRTCTFQFLYVSRGNHVVGVSAPFRVYNEPELHEFSLNLLFLEHVKKTNAASGLNKSPKRKTKTQINGQFEAVNGPTPKKRKDKMTAVYKDNNSLVEVPSFNDWATKVGLYMSSPIVEEYNLSNAVVKYEPRQVIPVYNTRWSSRTIQEVLKTLPDTPAYMLPIAYPDLQPIKAGPVSLLGLTGSCSHCQVAKTMVIDLVEREALQEHKLDTIKQQLIKFENEIDTIETQPVNVLDWAVTQLQEDNRGLKSRIDELEEKLADARTREENRLVELEEDPEPEPEDKEWSVRDPKRIVRLKKVLKRTSRNVKLLKQCNDNRNKQVLRLLADNNRLRRLVKGAIDTSNKFRAMSDELKMQVKCVLSARSKDVTNEWCRFTTQVKESTTQTSTNNTDAATSYDPKPSTTEDEKEESLPPVKQNMKNKQIARLIKAEKRQVARLHKEKGDAEKCPTCGLKFSKKADRRVIEEHIVFHQIMEK